MHRIRGFSYQVEVKVAVTGERWGSQLHIRNGKGVLWEAGDSKLCCHVLFLFLFILGHRLSTLIYSHVTFLHILFCHPLSTHCYFSPGISHQGSRDCHGLFSGQSSRLHLTPSSSPCLSFFLSFH